MSTQAQGCTERGRGKERKRYRKRDAQNGAFGRHAQGGNVHVTMLHIQREKRER